MHSSLVRFICESYVGLMSLGSVCVRASVYREEEEEGEEEEFIACMSFVFFMDGGCFLILLSSA